MTPRIIIDLRCLQEPDRARPGIAQLARDLVASRPQEASPVVGLFDPHLAPLGREIIGSLDALRPDAYFPALCPGTVFINPSPMTAAPLFAARVAGNAAVKRVAFVHNAVALDAQPCDCAADGGRLRVAVALAWLRQYDLLLPVCQAALRWLQEKFGGGRSAVGAVPLPNDVWRAVLGEATTDTLTVKAAAGCGLAGAKPRIAILSPFPPTHSGVADYSAAAVGALSAHAELALYSAEPNPERVAGLPVAPLSALPHLSDRADRVVSVLGNSEHHSRIYDLLTRFGGAAICHDSRLLHFYAHKNGERPAARLAAKELHREVGAAEIARWTQDEASREATLLGEAAHHAQPLIFHARASVELVRQRFDTPARYLPFALPHAWPDWVLDAARKRAAKDRLGFDPAKLHVASFGFLNANKAAAIALAALRRLIEAGFAAHLHFVGEPDAASALLVAEIVAAGLVRHVSLPTGYLSEAKYRDYLLAADLGLQLRNTGAGSVSGALQDCIAAGLPSVTNDSLADALQAPDYVVRVGDRLDPAEIAEALAGLFENPPIALAEQRAEYCDFHSMANYARRLCEILELEV